MAEVVLPRSLVALFPGAARRIAARGTTVAEVIADLDAQVPGIRNRIVDAGPEIRTHINVFVGGDRATLSTPVPDGATVHVIPAVSGGCRVAAEQTREGRRCRTDSWRAWSGRRNR